MSLPDAVREERALLSLKKEAFYDATDGIGLPSDVQDIIWTSFNRIGPCVCGGCEGVVCFRTNSTYPLKGGGPVLDEHIRYTLQRACVICNVECGTFPFPSVLVQELPQIAER